MIDLSSAYEVRDVLDNKVIDSIIDEFGNIWYESWKKLITSGIPPLTLQKCKGVDLVDYKIYGNSIQDGTPTPDNPIEIQSVGDKTKNLWKGLNYYESTITTRSLLFELYPSAYPCIKAGNTIAISVTCYLSENDTRTNLRASWQFYYADGTYSASKFYFYSKGQKVRVNMIVTIPSDKEVHYIVVRFTDFSNNPGNVWDGYIENIQIEESSTVTEYESPGYRIPVKVNDNVTNIYLNEPLRKVGDYEDYIDFENQKVVRNVKVVDDTGTLPIEESYQGLATPIEETIDLPTIPTNKGTNIIEVDTSILPSNMEVKYYGKE